MKHKINLLNLRNEIVTNRIYILTDGASKITTLQTADEIMTKIVLKKIYFSQLKSCIGLHKYEICVKETIKGRVQLIVSF